MTDDDPNTLLFQRVLDLVVETEVRPGYQILVRRDRSDPGGRVYVQIRCWRPDTFTAEYDWGYGGKAYLSPHAVDSEIVQTFFGLYKAYDEHECRETFLWRGVRIFGPHIDIRWLYQAAQHIDARPAPAKERTQTDDVDREDQAAAETRTRAAAAAPSGEGRERAHERDLSFPDNWRVAPPALDTGAASTEQWRTH